MPGIRSLFSILAILLAILVALFGGARREENMREASIWRVKAAEFRRMAERSQEVERERILSQLAARMEEQADAEEHRVESALRLPPDAEVVGALRSSA
jgi:hypothetical protein